MSKIRNGENTNLLFFADVKRSIELLDKLQKGKNKIILLIPSL